MAAVQLDAPADFGPPLVTITCTFPARAEAAELGTLDGATSSMVNEHEIREKLRKIEALFAGAATPGERDAASAARERIQRRLREYEKAEKQEEWRFSLENPWSRKLFIALARRYGLRPYRRSGQRRTTVMVSAPRSFVENTLIPEFDECNGVLVQHLDALATEIIESSLFSDTSDAEEARVLAP